MSNNKAESLYNSNDDEFIVLKKFNSAVLPILVKS